MTEEPDWSQFLPDLDLPSGGLEGGIELLQQTGIVELYWQWIGKSDPRGSTRVESIMVSCPMPHHRDENPSAWLNSDKNLWFCAACSVGGDIIDLAAIKFGIDYRGSGRPEDFVEVLEKALESIGVDVSALRAHNAATAPNVIDPSQIEPVERPSSPQEDQERLLSEWGNACLDWKSIVDAYPGSFLAKWMEATSISDIPDEYLFWLGLQMIGLSIGRDCWLNARTPVYPNLLLCIIGRTGMGKSSSVKFADKVIREALPFDNTDASCKGVQMLGRPASGEALYEMFAWVPEGETEAHPTRGFLDVDELSELMSAANRRGSTLKEAVIGISDNRDAISHRSRSFGSIEVVKPFMSIVVGGQPDRLSKVLSSEEAASGFANRFIFVDGSKKPRRSWFDVPKIDLTGLALKLQTLHNWAKQHGAGREEGSIDLEDDAALEFDELLKFLDTVVEGQGGDLFARMELHAMKLIVILCINAKVDLATKQIVEHVSQIIHSLLPATTAVAETIAKREDQWYEDVILRRIERAHVEGALPPTRSEIEHSFNSRKRNKAEIARVLTNLERIGLIKKVRLKETDDMSLKDRTKARMDRWMLSD